MNDDDISITYGPEAGDCTRPYYITLKRKNITVDEFIKWVLKQTREWGYISIGGKNPFKSDYSLEYKHGVAKGDGIIPKNILTSVISEASGSGGWTRSDYHLTIKKKVKRMARPNVVKLVGVDSKNGEISAVYISHELSGYKGKFVPDRPHGEWTTESAIDYLTETGWLPEHDRILTDRPHGHWVHGKCLNGSEYCHCSECDESALYDSYGNYEESDCCPNCGAEMDEEGDEK